MLSKTLVPVSSATSSALVETGEQRSPKSTPDRTAPPIRRMSTPIAPPIVAQITPMVAALPKEVPIRTDTAQLSRKVIRRKTPGRISAEA